MARQWPTSDAVEPDIALKQCNLVRAHFFVFFVSSSNRRFFSFSCSSVRRQLPPLLRDGTTTTRERKGEEPRRHLLGARRSAWYAKRRGALGCRGGDHSPAAAAPLAEESCAPEGQPGRPARKWAPARHETPCKAPAARLSGMARSSYSTLFRASFRCLVKRGSQKNKMAAPRGAPSLSEIHSHLDSAHSRSGGANETCERPRVRRKSPVPTRGETPPTLGAAGATHLFGGAATIAAAGAAPGRGAATA